MDDTNEVQTGELARLRLRTSLRTYTAARVALSRAGNALATGEHLAFQLDHALARDAVHSTLDVCSLNAGLKQRGLAPVAVRSRVGTPEGQRHAYLRRPDLGRVLDEHSETRLKALADGHPEGWDGVIIVGDGLSARAVERNALPLLDELLPRLRACGWSLGPVAVVTGARVAIGDAIGATLRARSTVMLIGERPGLSAADSLGAYLTWDPRPGRTDAERNCLSNIREGGLGASEAAERICALLGEAHRLRYTGVSLKESSTPALPD